MIAYISGKILEKSPGSVIIDVNGVGYEVFIPLTTFYDLGDLGSEAKLRIFTYVREDTLQLFGFSSAKEKELYLKLLSVQGIGAKSGIAMLSGMNADEIITAIRTENFARLTAIPGVGKKTAERLVIELREKIGELSSTVSASASMSAIGSIGEDSAFDDALSALINLGYQRVAAEKALQQAAKDGVEIKVQKLLRAALQRLSK